VARRAQPLTGRAAGVGAPPPAVLAGGLAALGVSLALTLGAAAVVWARAEGGARWAAADWRAVEFTVTQAALSAALSVAAALPVARALSRRDFPGRGAALALLGAPFLLPSIVAILGVIAVWGRSGWVGDALAAAGLPRPDVYGLPGVLIAHVFFNLPLAARLLLQAYAAVPTERWRVAAQLGAEGWALWRLVEWPALRGAAAGAAALVFSLCAASFAVALTLGGGPRATTVELAIYQAAAFEFDLGRAAALSLAQLGLCAAATAAALALAPREAAGPGLSAAPGRLDGAGGGARARDAAALAAAGAFLGAPLAAAVVSGAGALGAMGPAAWAAAGRSLAVALGSTALALALALPAAALIAALSRRGARRAAAAAQAAALAPLAASPFVVGIAAFVLLAPHADPAALALPLTAAVNAAMAAPFAVGALVPALTRAGAERGRLADSLGLTGAMRLRVLYWPALRAPLGFAAGVAAALSAGDLGVIALFSRPDAPTLPLYAQQLAAARRLDEAQAAALLLTGLSFALFAAFDRLGRGR
jgi:thiamine transport system permease protein